MDNVVTVINTGMDYIKKYNPINLDFLKSISITKFNAFSLGPNDASDAPVIRDISGSSEPFDADQPNDDTNPFLELIIDIVLYLLYYISYIHE